jgi:hypothetical protein
MGICHRRREIRQVNILYRLLTTTHNINKDYCAVLARDSNVTAGNSLIKGIVATYEMKTGEEY